MLGAEEAYVYAMGQERWLVGNVMATTYKRGLVPAEAG